jgi:hypothetical protein
MTNRLRNSAIALGLLGGVALLPGAASAGSIHDDGDFGGSWNRIGPSDVGYRHRYYRNYGYRDYGYRSYGYYAPRYRYAPAYSYYGPYSYGYYGGPGIAFGGPGFSVGIY